MKHPKNTLESPMLSNMLSHEMGLYIKTRKLQWNVLGEDFPYLSKLFHSLYMGIEETIALVSDRINLLGGKAASTIKKSAELSRQNDLPDNNNSKKEMMTDLLTEQEAMMTDFRKEIEESDKTHSDTGSNDFLLDIMEQRKTTNSILQNISSTISNGSASHASTNP